MSFKAAVQSALSLPYGAQAIDEASLFCNTVTDYYKFYLHAFLAYVDAGRRRLS